MAISSSAFRVRSPDFCFACYLSDLAVDRAYQHQGIGKELVRLTKEAIGEQTTLVLIAAPEAVDYYPKIGFQCLAEADGSLTEPADLAAG